MMTEELHQQLEAVTNDPGVYIYRNRQGAIIYVGKAVNLKRRTASYFNSDTKHSGKTLLMVSQIASIETIVVRNEREALLLENNLIKENKPKFNIRLKDDKTYPWICITKEEFPRIIVTRRYNERLGTYYGPYTNIDTMKRTFTALREFLPYRTCKLPLTEERVKNGLFTSCLEYHIKKCNAPCIGRETKGEYSETIDIVKHLLQGKVAEITHILRAKMEECIEKLNFEQADNLHRTIEALKLYQEKNSIVNPKMGGVDAIAILSRGGYTACTYIQIREGRIILTVTKEIQNPLEEDEPEVLRRTIMWLHARYTNWAPLLITNVITAEPIEGYESVDQDPKGEKKGLMEIALINTKKLLIELENKRQENHEEILERMQKDLSLSRIPKRIECIDNSNTLGTFPVSACVVFTDGKPDKKEYRSYNVKNVVGPNDYATMEEVITRRYGKMPDADLPDLLILDGGKGQLHVGLETLKRIDKLGKFDIVALAEKREEIFKPDDSYPLYINKNSPSLYIIQQLRDEAHRFGVKRHTKRRDDSIKESILYRAKGIAIKTVEKLYQHYSSPAEILAAPIEEIAELIGIDKAKRVIEFLKERTK